MSARSSLEALYTSTNGATRWRVRKHWLDNGNICRWYGIDCVRGDVTSIDLGGNRLLGTLPSEVAALTSLRVLNIDESSLSGTLPYSVKHLRSLDTLLLASNPLLSGSLPSHIDFQPSVFDVSSSRLSGTIAASLMRQLAPRTHRLQLDHMRVSGSVPSEVGDLHRARYIFVHASPMLSGTLPTQLGNLGTTLLGTSFAGTRLSGTIPTQLGRLSQLRSLWLVNTSLSGTLPSQIGQLGRVKELELHKNRLSGSLPYSLGATGAPLKASLRRCVLTASQGPYQPLHSMRPAEKFGESESNRFSCPLPNLPAPCVAHLSCKHVADSQRRNISAPGDISVASNQLPESIPMRRGKPGRGGRGRGRRGRGIS